jgi:hypothetical protein
MIFESTSYCEEEAHLNPIIDMLRPRLEHRILVGISQDRIFKGFFFLYTLWNIGKGKGTLQDLIPMLHIP